MDERTFDDVVRRWSTAGSRRGVLKSAFGSTLAGLGIAWLVAVDDAEAKSCEKKCKEKKDKKKRKECKKKCQAAEQCIPKAPEAPCASSEECCPNETKYTCGLSHNSGLTNVCCGTQGATCSTTFQCCREPISFNCVGGQCVPM